MGQPRSGAADYHRQSRASADASMRRLDGRRGFLKMAALAGGLSAAAVAAQSAAAKTLVDETTDPQAGSVSLGHAPDVRIVNEAGTIIALDSRSVVIDASDDATPVVRSAFENLPIAGSGKVVFGPGEFVVDSITLDRFDVSIVGAGWSTELRQRSIGENLLQFSPDVNRGDQLTGLTIADLSLKGRGRSPSSGSGAASAITNMQAGGFPEGSDGAINHAKIRNVLFSEWTGLAPTVAIRNPDNRFSFDHCRWINCEGQQLYLEANHRAAGGVSLLDNEFLYGGDCVVIRNTGSPGSNFSRFNILNNAFLTNEPNVRHVVIDNEGSGFCDKMNIAFNSFDIGDAAGMGPAAIHVGGSVDGGSSAAPVRGISMKDNWFFARSRSLAPEATLIHLDKSYHCTVEDNFFQGSNGSGLVAVRDSAAFNNGNRIGGNWFSRIDTPIEANRRTQFSQTNIGYSTENRGLHKMSAPADNVVRIPHGLADVPNHWTVTPASAAAASAQFFVEADATDLLVRYVSPPSGGIIQLAWDARL